MKVFKLLQIHSLFVLTLCMLTPTLKNLSSVTNNVKAGFHMIAVIATKKVERSLRLSSF